jgi:FtsK/SpoIIIE family/FtsK alpha domain
VLGRLGLAAVLAYIEEESAGSTPLIVSLDTASARDWLNLREGPERRADLLAFTWSDTGVTVNVVEVKARTGHIDWAGAEPDVVAEAVDQVREMRRLVDRVFGLSPDDALTPSRREVLKRQVFLEALQQWDPLRESDKAEYESRIKRLNSLFSLPMNVTVESKVFVVSTNENAEPGTRLASDHETMVTVLGVPWLKRVLEHREGGSIEIAADLLDEFIDLDAEMLGSRIADESTNLGLATASDPRDHVPADVGSIALERVTSLVLSTPSSSSSGDPDVDFEELAPRLREALVARGAPLRAIEPDLATIGPSVIQVPFRLAKGARLSTLQSQEADIARDLGVTAVRLSNWSGGAGYATIEMPRPNRHIADVTTLSLEVPSPGEISLAIGAGLDFTPHVVNLSDLPHLLVAGTTGSGKSVFLRSLLWQLTHRYSPSEIDLVVIDAKGMADYIDFRRAPHIKNAGDFHSGVAGALELLADIVDRRLPERVATFNEYANDAYERELPVQIANVPQLIADARTRGVEPPLRPLVVLIDEFAELVMATSDRKRFETLVTRFNQLARAIGGHLIAATQRPSTDVVTGVMKSNFARLALRVQSAVDSRVILDDAGAEALLGKGDLLFRSPADGLVRLQGYNAPGPYRFSRVR